MAFLDDSIERVTFNVDWTVGSGCFNHKDDVMLVQMLFNMAFFGDGKDAMPNGYDLKLPEGETGGLKVDGICGPQTIKFIKTYQRSVKGLYCDGKVDPYYGDGRRTKTGQFFLMKHLCAAAEVCDAPWYYSFIVDEDTPLLLRNSLTRVDTEARQHTQSWPQPAPKVIDPVETWLRLGWL
jgi:hypothetical protein